MVVYLLNDKIQDEAKQKKKKSSYKLMKIPKEKHLNLL